MKTLSAPATNVKERDELSEDLRRLVESQVDVVGWNGDQADCVCPGDHLHGPAGAKYATVFMDGKWPLVACFHQSCHQARAEVNAALRTEAIPS